MMKVKPTPIEATERAADNKRYALPKFLLDVTPEKVYRKWLDRKAVTHHRRDKKRFMAVAPTEMYRLEIHRAVMASEGKDFYATEFLDWPLLSKYRNEPSKGLRKKYKQAFALLPTVDHVGDAEGRPHFVICAWRTNDSKGDLSYKEFVEVCARVLETAKGARRPNQPAQLEPTQT
jgi:hypothetical protein